MNMDREPVAVQKRYVPQPSQLDQPSHQPFSKRIRRADLFPKPREDFQREQSKNGALVSLGAAALISSLLVWEFGAYIAGRDAYSSELVVIDDKIDARTSDARVPVHIDITFPSIQCHNLWLDVLDISDGFEEQAVQDLMKTPVSSWGYRSFSQRYDFDAQQRALAAALDAKHSKSLNNEFDDQLRAHANNEHGGGDGELRGQRIGNMILYIPQRDIQHKDYCGHCYVDRHLGTAIHKKEATCCNTCKSVMESFDNHRLRRPSPETIEQCLFEESKKNPGCNIKGTFLVKRVKGNFHFRPGVGTVGMFGEHTHDYDMGEAMRFNVSHDIHHLSFGDISAKRFTSTHSSEAAMSAFPLDGQSIRTRHSLESVIYLLSVVPATYTTTLRGTDTSFEFSAQHQSAESSNRIQGMGLTFQFDFYSMQLNNRFKRPAFGHFLVQLCGIIGGLFVVMGFVDRGVEYWSELRKAVL